jgi:hypothetical protein
LTAWFEFVGFKPELFYDDEVSSSASIAGVPGDGEYVGTTVWYARAKEVGLEHLGVELLERQ